jgi:hypothetical protein
MSKLNQLCPALQENFINCLFIMGQAVAHLVEALRYKPEGRGFNSRWCHWNFSLT